MSYLPEGILFLIVVVATVATAACFPGGPTWRS